jgi:hypothetical protein
MTDNQKTAMWSVVGVVAIIIIAAWIWRSSGTDNQTANTSNTAQVASTGETASSTDSTPTSTPKAATPAQKSLAYTQAINTYQYRIQFSDCRGTVGNSTNVGTLSIKKGTKFLLDNRDPEAHTIAFKGQSYKIPAYGYVVATATTVGEYPVTCDGGGAAVLKVQ